jgi:DNA-binding response OmpR family regulator
VPSDLGPFGPVRTVALLVTPNEEVRGRLELLLLGLGITVIWVVDCKVAREDLRTILYPLVIIDRAAAGSEKLDLVSMIRNGSPERTFIVALTAMDGEDDAATALTTGADAYVSVLWSDEEIVESLRNVLSTSSARAN